MTTNSLFLHKVLFCRRLEKIFKGEMIAIKNPIKLFVTTLGETLGSDVLHMFLQSDTTTILLLQAIHGLKVLNDEADERFQAESVMCKDEEL